MQGDRDLEYPKQAYNMKPQSHLSDQVSQMLFVVLVLILSLEVVKSQFLVKGLPGFAGDLPFKLETGYVGVGESEAVQLFYYFIESEGNPKDDPLILWISGGPGCSSLFGLYHIGPFTFNTELSTLEMPIIDMVSETLTKMASMIFLDLPIGSGFSYAKTSEAYMTNDTLSAIHGYDFLRKWLVRHPKFLNNPFYLGADSYSGIVLPIIADEVYNGNEVGRWPLINIKGYILGNPVTDLNGDYNARHLFARNMALISEEIYESAKKNCNGEYLIVDPNNSQCKQDQMVDKCLERINEEYILGPQCPSDEDTSQSHLFRKGLEDFDKTKDVLREVQTQLCSNEKFEYSAAWANRKDVREALHTLEEFGDNEWVACNTSLRIYSKTEVKAYKHNVFSSVSYHQHLVERQCRALIYSGDHDLIVSYVGTLSWIQSLNLSVVDDWKPWFVDTQVAGYTQKYSKDEYNLTYATVKGAGHVAPAYKHKESLSLLKRWLVNDTL